MHPDSNWGRSVYDVVLNATGDGLVGELPAIPAAPGMDDLLPDLPESLLANQTTPEPVLQTVGLDQGQKTGSDKATPALGGLLAAVVVGLALMARRRA